MLLVMCDLSKCVSRNRIDGAKLSGWVLARSHEVILSQSFLRTLTRGSRTLAYITRISMQFNFILTSPTQHMVLDLRTLDYLDRSYGVNTKLWHPGIHRQAHKPVVADAKPSLDINLIVSKIKS